MYGRVTELVADDKHVRCQALLLELRGRGVAGIWFGLVNPLFFRGRHRVSDLGLQEGRGQCLPLLLGLVSLSSLLLTVCETHRAQEAREARSRHGRVLGDVQALARTRSWIVVLRTRDLRPVASVPVKVVDALDLLLGKVQADLDLVVVHSTLAKAVGVPL